MGPVTGRTDARLKQQADEFYPVLRTVCASARIARSLAGELLAQARERPELAARSDDGLAAWLRAAALEQIARDGGSVLHRPGHAEGSARRHPSTNGAAISGLASERVHGVDRLRADIGRQCDENALAAVAKLDDSSLLVVLRGLPLDARQTLGLTYLFGLEREGVAGLLGQVAGRIDAVVDDGLAELAKVFAAHQVREVRRSTLAAKPAPRLRPLPPGAGGTVVIRGTRLHLERDGPSSLFELMVAVLTKLIDHLRHHNKRDPLDDDVGETRRKHSRSPAPPRTATTQAIGKPKRTPTLKDYKLPQSTAGTMGYRSPRATPSTERLSSPSRPAGSRGGGLPGYSGGRRH